VTSNTSVGSGGFDEVYGQTTATIVGSGGEEAVFDGGQSTSATTQKGGVLDLLAGGEGFRDVIAGIEIISARGGASEPTIMSGGVLVVARFATAEFAHISRGGIAKISGTDRDATITGGQEVVFGGVSENDFILGGGKLVISSGGTGQLDIVQSGGLLSALAGATTIDASVSRGGREIVASGGTANATTISGGTLEIMSGGSTGSSAVTFATSAGGILQLDSSLTFSGLVAGFGKPDRLDFRDIAFTSGVTHTTWTQSGTTSGTLAVTSGTHTATVTLLGQYVAGNFHVSTDGHGGTYVTDPPVSTSQTVALVNTHQT
jgi:autotransporter passenger strand-loop-strand repeat protein